MDRKGSSGRNVIEPLYCSYENYNDVSYPHFEVAHKTPAYGVFFAMFSWRLTPGSVRRSTDEPICPHSVDKLVDHELSP